MEVYLPVVQEFKSILNLCNSLLKYTALETGANELDLPLSSELASALKNW